MEGLRLMQKREKLLEQETDCTNPEWYVVHCMPFKEQYAATGLRAMLGLAVYLPQVQSYFRGHVQRAPWFPRYLFARADLQIVPPSSINAVPGVVRLISVDSTPQPISFRVIEAIRQQVDQLNAQGGLPNHHFKQGDSVRLRDGPLHGLEAVFVGPMEPSARVRVLIDFLGRLQEIKVKTSALEHVSSAHIPKLERWTRGKGRRIKHHG
jgi:transcription antitermination factor NusG